MKITLYTANGDKKGSIELNDHIFNSKINVDLMHRAVVMRLSNARMPIAHTKTRGEVIASTKKMFRQKGTGNARRGAKSAPLLRGGGVAHGPRNNVNYKISMPKKERQRALFSSLSSKAKENAIFALEDSPFQKPGTKDFALLLKKFPEAKKYLFVLPEKNFAFERSGSNIPKVMIMLANYLNPYDVLHADKICFLGSSLEKLEETFLN